MRNNCVPDSGRLKTSSDTTSAVFAAIAAAHGVISGDSIGATLGITRNAVNKHVAKLRNMGVKIISSGAGYNYLESDVLSETTLAWRLKGDWDVRVCECDSTNNIAKQLRDEFKGNYIVAAPIQSAGRGRLKRKFISDIGGAYMTIAMKPNDLSPLDSLNLVLLSAVAVARVLDKYGVKNSIKWPNDVLVSGKKISGILLESTFSSERIECVYIGIGINVSNNIEELKDIAISLAQLGVSADRERIICDVADEILELIHQFPHKFSAIREEYLSRSCTIGNDVCVAQSSGNISGRAVGVSDIGYLIIDSKGVISEIVAGDLMNTN